MLGVKQLKKDLSRNTLVLDAGQMVWLAQNSERLKNIRKVARKKWKCFWSKPKEVNAAVAAEQTDRQRDVTCDTSTKESEEAGKTWYQEQLVDNEVERRKVCTRAKERLVVKATGNTGTLTWNL